MKRRSLTVLLFAALLLAQALWLLPHSSAAQAPALPRPGQPQPAGPAPEQYAPITDLRVPARPVVAPAAPLPEAAPGDYAPDAAAPQRIPPSVLGDSGDPVYAASVSADGRYVAFYSYADNLVADDMDGYPDVFVYDRQTGQTELVSQASDGSRPWGYFYEPSISDDGRYVAFYGYGDGLVPNDTNNADDVYVHDRQTGATTRVSVKSNGAEANNASYAPAISATGQYVVFVSYATNLVSGDTNGMGDIFLHNRTTGVTTRVSLKAANTQVNDSSWSPTVSADGRYVAFYSYATNLVTGDTNGQSDIFVRDVTAKTTARVSVSSGGAQADYWSEAPEISDNGRYVTFTSYATNLVPGDANGDSSDIFIRDRQTNTTTLVSRDAAGNQAEWAYGSSLSADGALVAFESPSGLLPGGAAYSYDIFVRNWQTGTIVRASVSNGGAAGDGESWDPSLSADGTAVGFTSVAANLTPGDNNGANDIFVRKLSQNQTNLASGDAFAFTAPNHHSDCPALSLDGRYVAYCSTASNLVPGDDNQNRDIFVTDRQTGATTLVSEAYWGGFIRGASGWDKVALSDNGRYVAFSGYGAYFVEDDYNDLNDIFVRDRQTNTTARVSVDSGGGEANNESFGPSLSADGNLVAFYSYASNLVPGDSNGWIDVFVHNRATGATSRVSVSAAGAQANSDSFNADIAAGGRFVAFESYASNLVAGDNNGMGDVFVRDLQTGQTELISRAYDGSGSDSDSVAPVISSDGRYVAFQSFASNLVPDDGNGGLSDIFLYDRQTGQMALISRNAGGSANGESYSPTISHDGRYVSFESWADNLVQGDQNGYKDIYVYDRVADAIGRASVNAAGQGADLWSHSAALSGDGQKIAFVSGATNFIANDTYGFDDVFVTDRPAGVSGDPHDVFYISPSGSGKVGGIAFAPADILRYTRSTNTWQMIYDGSVRGTPKNVAAFDETWWGDWLLVFGANQVIPGLGTATPRDIVLFTPNNRSSYPLGAGTYSWYLRGVDIGLTTSAENIDALHVNDSDVYISTAGAAAVGPGGSIKAQDEDVLTCWKSGSTCDWQATLVLDGSTIPGMAAEDVGGLSIGPINGNTYVTLPGAFNVGGVKGSGKSILSLRPNGGAWIVKNVDWLAPGVTFPSNLDGLSLRNPYP